MEKFSLKVETNIEIAGALFPVDSPRGIVQIIHGALEYKERYLPVAKFLQAHGFVVVLSDNRGHGQSQVVGELPGFMPDYRALVDDQVAITHLVKARYPQVPYYLLGHSFGSILARLYLQDHDAEIEKLILTGTANYNKVVPVGLALAPLFLKIFKPTGHSKLLAKLTGDLESGTDWLTSDAEFNRVVALDEKMLKQYPVASAITIWQADYQLKQYKNFKCQNPQLEILSIAGALDKKVTGGPKGLADTVATLKKIGYTKTQSQVISGMWHEVLLEKNNAMVFEMLLNFLEES